MNYIRDTKMSDEYEHKLEAKSDIVSDTSSIGASDIDQFSKQNYQIKNYITHIVGGRLMFFLKTQNILEFNTH